MRGVAIMYKASVPGCKHLQVLVLLIKSANCNWDHEGFFVLKHVEEHLWQGFWVYGTI